jgi:thiosulfate dehydrogenase
MRGFLFGLIVGVALLCGGVLYYFVSGTAPAAASDAPMPMEKKIASLSLRAHIEKANVPSPPIPPSEENLLGGAKVYKNQCAGCHGLPDQAAPLIADKMYPVAPLLFKGKGVTDDPPQESYWKATNGIRLTGMPGFKDILSDTERWQVAQLVANADKIPDSVKKALYPDPVPGAPVTPASTK